MSAGEAPRIAESGPLSRPASELLLLDSIDDHLSALRRFEMLLHSIKMAAKEDGEWAGALCDIGSSWCANEGQRIRDVRDCVSTN